MNRTTIKNRINDALRITTNGLHKDDYWAPVNAAWKAIRLFGYEVSISSAEYTENEEGVPISKTWKFEVIVDERSKPFFGILTAHGAGTVEDPLCKYDIFAYVS